MTAATSAQRIHHRWFGRACVVALVYATAGIGFAELAKSAGAHETVVAWRLAAWIISAIAFAAHIRLDGVRYRFAAVQTAYHAAVASALGAFGLAASAAAHSYLGSPAHRFPMIALLVWPLITGVPAFVVAYAVAILFRRAS